jgi:hypothetical protein
MNKDPRQKRRRELEILILAIRNNIHKVAFKLDNATKHRSFPNDGGHIERLKQAIELHEEYITEFSEL